MNQAEANIQQALFDPDRVCPVLATAALIRGGELKIRLHGTEHVVKAPARYLRRVHEWCDGGHTMSQIRGFARAPSLGPSFTRFLDALFDAGILIDAARSLLDASRLAHYPSWNGLAAPQETWTHVTQRLPDSLPEDAMPLPPAPAVGLLQLLGDRRSARDFGDEPVRAEDLSTVLHALYGACGQGARRTVASAGGFYTLIATVCLLKPIGPWPEGVYRVRYARDGAGLEPLPTRPDFLPRAFVQPRRLRGAAFVIVLSSDMQPGTLKYRNRFFQYVFIEAGAAMQNAALACAQTGLGLRTLGGFDERLLGEMLALGHSTPLITSVGGSIAPAGLNGGPSPRDVKAGWSHSSPQAPFIVASASIRNRSGSFDNTCWGRDPDPQIALDKAVAEAVERNAYRTRPQCMESSATALDRPWLHPDQLVRYSPQQYRSAGFPFARFDPDEPRLWAECRRVDTDEPMLVPAEFVYHRTSFDGDQANRLLTNVSSSGCASHGSREQAIASAVSELVERDAFSRHWLAQAPGTLVDPASLPPSLAAQMDDLSREGIQAQVQVLGSSLMPVWFIWLQSEKKSFTCVASATGFKPADALRSALAEAHTAAMVRLAAPNEPRTEPREVRTPRDHADLYARRRYFRRADALRSADAGVSYAAATSAWPSEFSQLVAAIRAAGSDAFLVDLTLPDTPATWDETPLVSFRALVPGTIPLGFGHGRMPFDMAPVAPGGRFPHPFP